MAHFCTYTAPFAVHGTIGELYQIQGVIHERLKFIKRCIRVPVRLILKLACNAAAHNRKRLSPNLFRKTEIFIKSETI